MSLCIGNIWSQFAVMETNWVLGATGGSVQKVILKRCGFGPGKTDDGPGGCRGCFFFWQHDLPHFCDPNLKSVHLAVAGKSSKEHPCEETSFRPNWLQALCFPASSEQVHG